MRQSMDVGSAECRAHACLVGPFMSLSMLSLTKLQRLQVHTQETECDNYLRHMMSSKNRYPSRWRHDNQPSYRRAVSLVTAC